MGRGICYHGMGEAVVERIDGKRLAKAWLDAVLAGVELDDVEI